MYKLFERLLKLAVIATFIYGLFTEQHYYSVFLRWLVFVSSLYFAFNSIQVIGVYGIRFSLIFFCAIAILFNPFLSFNFSETIWRIIDIVICILIASTLDWKEYKESLSPRGILLYNLISKCIFGVFALIAAFFFVFSIAGNPYHEYLLITKGATATGFITNIDEDTEERDAGGYTYYYTYSYNFKTPDGNTIQSQQQTSGGVQIEMPDLSNPYKIEIVYLKSNPEINKIKNTLSSGIGEFLWRKVGLGTGLLLLFSSIGFIAIKKAIKVYSAERKKIIKDI